MIIIICYKINHSGEYRHPENPRYESKQDETTMNLGPVVRSPDKLSTG